MLNLFIDQQGVIEAIYSDSLLPILSLGTPEIRRASHVEPAMAGDGSPCWYADMGPSNGPTLGPFKSRQEALDEEVKWLLENRLGGQDVENT